MGRYVKGAQLEVTTADLRRVPLDQSIGEGDILVLRHTHQQLQLPYFLARVKTKVDKSQIERKWVSASIVINWLENATAVAVKGSRQKGTGNDVCWQYLVDKQEHSVGTDPIAGVLRSLHSPDKGKLIIDPAEHAAIMSMIGWTPGSNPAEAAARGFTDPATPAAGVDDKARRHQARTSPPSKGKQAKHVPRVQKASESSLAPGTRFAPSPLPRPFFFLFVCLLCLLLCE